MHQDEKVLILTIDTEADDQWSVSGRKNLTVNNILQLPRLQGLFSKYDIIPTYLVSYPVINDEYSCGILNELLQDGTCEIGAHLHSWDTPPISSNEITNALKNTYITDTVFEKKLLNLQELIEKKLKITVQSYRGGRYGISKTHIKILSKRGFLVDSSILPHGIFPSTSLHNREFNLIDQDVNTPFLPVKGYSLYEIVPSVFFETKYPLLKKLKTLHKQRFFSFFCKHLKLGSFIWVRPYFSTVEDLKFILLHNELSYLNIMFHSSELIPNGSPYYSTWDEVTSLYVFLEDVFKLLIMEYQFKSMGISSYVNKWIDDTKISLIEQ